MATTVDAPRGAHWEYVEVRTNHGKRSLGEAPVLEWDDVEAARQFYGEEALKQLLEIGVKNQYLRLARTGRIRGMTDDEIARSQLSYKPGQRQARSPVGKVSKAARAAAERASPDVVAALLEAIARGEITADDLRAIAG